MNVKCTEGRPGEKVRYQQSVKHTDPKGAGGTIYWVTPTAWTLGVGATCHRVTGLQVPHCTQGT